MNSPSSLKKAIAKSAAAAFGGSPTVDRYWDDDHRSSIDVVTCKPAPWKGVSSYATIGVSDVSLNVESQGLDVRTEFVGACGDEFKEFANYLSTAAFFVINSGWSVAPGVIFPDIISMYKASPTMKHFLFLPPFLWDEKLKKINSDSICVTWLLAVPISDGEMELARRDGVPALEVLFERAQIDIFNLNRASVI